MVTANKTGQNITEEGPSLKPDVEKLRKPFYSGVLNLSLKKNRKKCKGMQSTWSTKSIVLLPHLSSLSCKYSLLLSSMSAFAQHVHDKGTKLWQSIQRATSTDPIATRWITQRRTMTQDTPHASLLPKTLALGQTFCQMTVKAREHFFESHANPCCSLFFF